ncbi:MAG: hypothetical protein HOQ05_13855 [Corynebacteriales bacterium]|nr:hypothetical protein [Mycobacteriales bacterium]
MSSTNAAKTKPVRLDFRRTSPQALLLGALLLLAIEAALIGYLVKPEVFTSDEMQPNWVIWFCAIVLGLMIIILAAAVPAMLKKHSMTFDDTGIHWFDRGTELTIGWEQIGGIGVSWRRRTTSTARGSFTKRKYALELFPADAAFATHHPELSLYRAAEPMPAPGLTPYRYRFMLPPLSPAPAHAAALMEHFYPGKWLGEYERQS